MAKGGSMEPPEPEFDEPAIGAERDDLGTDVAPRHLDVVLVRGPTIARRAAAW
jgi:hypothetical protein